MMALVSEDPKSGGAGGALAPFRRDLRHPGAAGALPRAFEQAEQPSLGALRDHLHVAVGEVANAAVEPQAPGLDHDEMAVPDTLDASPNSQLEVMHERA